MSIIAFVLMSFLRVSMLKMMSLHFERVSWLLPWAGIQGIVITP